MVVVLAIAAASITLVGARSHSNPAAASPVPTTKTGKPIVETVTWASPAPGASGVSPATVIALRFTEPLAAGSPMPRLSPPVAGTWTLSSPTTLVFQPSATFVPGTSESVIVPAGADGLVGADGERTSAKLTVGFHIAAGSTLRLQQLLADLGYLPLSFTASASDPMTDLNEAMPQVGTFAWRWQNLPSSLTTLWSPGSLSVMTQGAIMEFENAHGLTTDGIAGPQVWVDLLNAVRTHSVDTQAYNYVYVQKSPDPENVTVFSNGKSVFNTLANTGIAAAPTPDGTWPVDLRYTVTTMTGTNPDGSHYSDSGIPWVSYFHGGDALHGFIRSQYGFPQSLGCVEMPFASAAIVYPLTPIGTLVTVQ